MLRGLGSKVVGLWSQDLGFRDEGLRLGGLVLQRVLNI